MPIRKTSKRVLIEIQARPIQLVETYALSRDVDGRNTQKGIHVHMAQANQFTHDSACTLYRKLLAKGWQPKREENIMAVQVAAMAAAKRYMAMRRF
jgi:hypothetical protein